MAARYGSRWNPAPCAPGRSLWRELMHCASLQTIPRVAALCTERAYLRSPLVTIGPTFWVVSATRRPRSSSRPSSRRDAPNPIADNSSLGLRAGEFICNEHLPNMGDALLPFPWFDLILILAL